MEGKVKPLFTMPQWRKKAELVLINCQQVVEMTNKREYIVQFETKRGNFTSFVEKQHVDPVNKRLHAYIYADVEGKGVLVRLPTETLNSGPQILVYESEKDDVLTYHDWSEDRDS